MRSLFGNMIIFVSKVPVSRGVEFAMSYRYYLGTWMDYAHEVLSDPKLGLVPSVRVPYVYDGSHMETIRSHIVVDQDFRSS